MMTEKEALAFDLGILKLEKARFKDEIKNKKKLGFLNSNDFEQLNKIEVIIIDKKNRLREVIND